MGQEDPAGAAVRADAGHNGRQGRGVGRGDDDDFGGRGTGGGGREGGRDGSRDGGRLGGGRDGGADNGQEDDVDIDSQDNVVGKHNGLATSETGDVASAELGVVTGAGEVALVAGNLVGPEPVDLGAAVAVTKDLSVHYSSEQGLWGN